MKLPEGSTLILAAPQESKLMANLAAWRSGASLHYLQNYGDPWAVYAPSCNPLKFLSELALPFALSQNANYPILGR
jgi:hypothetical protein